MEKTRILLVEDEPILAELMREDLGELGYEVVDAVGDGDMVLHAFLKHRPAVILMDIKLQGFRDGIDSAAQIRAFYAVPIVFLSSYSEAEMAPRLAKIKGYLYVQKPYDVTELDGVIRSVTATKTSP
ncbi:MAG: response regulator [Spirochaetales bacterium]